MVLDVRGDARFAQVPWRPKRVRGTRHGGREQVPGALANNVRQHPS
jgi:hypothetical protein